MASFELTETHSTENPASRLIPRDNRRKKPISLRNFCILVLMLVIIFCGSIVGTVFITKSYIENNNLSSSESSSEPSISPTRAPTRAPTFNDTKSPKNLIVIISDGMGQTYNTAYRIYKNLTKTSMDKHFKGRYGTKPNNINGVTDSAAGATCFASRVRTHNSFIGLDGNGNPKGSILAAAKRKGKGTGIVVTKSVTDATPAAFSAHSMYRSWNEMISKQQATRQINDEPMIDILFGGGRRYFERWGFFQNESIWHDEYKWNTVTDNATEFINNLNVTDITKLPYMALFSDGSYPYYLDRLNGDVFINDTIDGIVQYPNLMQMTEKAVNLLSTKYEKEGFFLLVEASEVDWCGHRNDIVCMLWEMEEFMETTDWLLNWAGNDGETLVVMLSDHETGGLSIGRDGSYYDDKLIKYLDGTQARNGNVSGAWFSFDYDYSIAPPPSFSPTVDHYGAYKWMPQSIKSAKHTAQWFVDETGSSGSITSIEQLYDALERMYLGGDGNLKLSPLEKQFISDIWSRSSSTRRKGFVMLQNARTLTGWTTHGHTGSDCAVHAFGPMEDIFYGHWQNYEIGELMSIVFHVDQEQDIETQYLEKLFINGSLKTCDSNEQPSYIEWNITAPYPLGNLLYPGNCVEEWL